MGYAGDEGNAFAQLLISGITIALQFALERIEELSRPCLSPPTHSKIEDHRGDCVNMVVW